MTALKIHPVQELCLQAADVLRKHGWCRGDYARTAAGDYSDELSPAAAQFCAVGALWSAAGSRDKDDLVELAYDHVAEVGGVGLITFNDAVAKNKEEVIALFLRAADAEVKVKLDRSIVGYANQQQEGAWNS